jgi:hypothetical protein
VTFATPVVVKVHGPAIEAPSMPPPVMNDCQPASGVILVVAFAVPVVAMRARTVAPNDREGPQPGCRVRALWG